VTVTGAPDARSAAASEPVLCVDLDGTLTIRDTLVISILLLLRRKPWLVPLVPLALTRGRAAMKGFISRHVVPAPATLAWHGDVLSFLAEERSRGRRIALVTAAHFRVAQPMAEFLGCFDAVIASDDRHNLKSDRKLAAIRKAFGDKEFDYIGDSVADVPILRAARRAYVVGSSWRLQRRLTGLTTPERTFGKG
jgi:hypothetical protein